MYDGRDSEAQHEIKMKKKFDGFQDDFMGDRSRFINKHIDKSVDQIPNSFEYSKEIVENLMTENIVIRENPKTLIMKNKAEEVQKD